MFTSTTDVQAFSQVEKCNPQWVGMCQVEDILPDDSKRLLHAGPPFTQIDNIPNPVMNSLCVATVFEGWADNFDAARGMILDNTIRVEPAQDHGMVVPLAGIVSPSMKLMVVIDSNNASARKYSVLNEGMVHCTRLGKLDPQLQAHLIWLNGQFGDWVSSRLQQPIDLLPIIEKALAKGDDCHGRTIASSALIAEILYCASNHQVPGDIQDFLDGALAFALNIWMAACSLLMSAAEGVEGASLITKAGGNGYEFGVQVAGKAGHWITVKAPEVKGAIDAAHEGRTAVGTIGDSAVVDFMGLGGQVLNTATASFDALMNYLPEDVLARPDKAMMARFDGFGDGRKAITCARHVVDNNAGPVVLLGMIEDRGEAGRIGGGVADVPVSFFKSVLQELGR